MLVPKLIFMYRIGLYRYFVCIESDCTDTDFQCTETGCTEKTCTESVCTEIVLYRKRPTPVQIYNKSNSCTTSPQHFTKCYSLLCHKFTTNQTNGVWPLDQQLVIHVTPAINQNVTRFHLFNGQFGRLLLLSYASRATWCQPLDSWLIGRMKPDQATIQLRKGVKLI